MAAPPFKLPSKAVDAKQQRNAKDDEYDVVITCEDGTVHHAWYRKGWVGIEKIAGP